MIVEPIEITGTSDPRISGKGSCSRCGRKHGMIVGYAGHYAKNLLQTLIAKKRIDLAVPDAEADPRFSTDCLYGEARGHMFGVLVCRDKTGQTGLLKAFSGQYNGVWNVEGWVPPLVDTVVLERVSFGVERLIKRMGAMIESQPEDSPRRRELVEKRKAVSQALMKDIHAMYRIPNFRNELKPLPEVVYGDGGMPAGLGDCCAPKLLGYAALNGLTPLGMAEFFVGRENRSGSKHHGVMYTACKEKCGRILGYMLCGLGGK